MWGREEQEPGENKIKFLHRKKQKKQMCENWKEGGDRDQQEGRKNLGRNPVLVLKKECEEQ